MFMPDLDYVEWQPEHRRSERQAVQALDLRHLDKLIDFHYPDPADLPKPLPDHRQRRCRAGQRPGRDRCLLERYVAQRIEAIRIGAAEALGMASMRCAT